MRNRLSSIAYGDFLYCKFVKFVSAILGEETFIWTIGNRRPSPMFYRLHREDHKMSLLIEKGFKGF